MPKNQEEKLDIETKWFDAKIFDLYAAHAITGILANQRVAFSHNFEALCANRACKIAQHMMKERASYSLNTLSD